jgi:hypothetical protein
MSSRLLINDKETENDYHQLNLVRCLFGAVGTAIVQIMYNAIGAGWTTTIFSAICILGVPMEVWVVKSAPRWRAQRRAKMQRPDGVPDGKRS